MLKRRRHPSAFAARLQDRFDVQYRGPVDRLELGDPNPRFTVDLENCHAVQPDRIRAIWRARAEDAVKPRSRIVARTHAKDAAIRLVQPGEHKHFLPNAEIARRVSVLRRDHEPRIGCALVPLLRCVGSTDERRAHSPDRIQSVHLVERRVI